MREPIPAISQTRDSLVKSQVGFHVKDPWVVVLPFPQRIQAPSDWPPVLG